MHGLEKYSLSEALEKKFKSLQEEMLNEEPVPFTIPKDKLNDPSSIDLKKIAGDAQKAEDDRIAAEKEAQRKAELEAKAKPIIDAIQSETKEDMKPGEELELWFEKLVPGSGKCETKAGEIVRAMMRILYRDWNDGDRFFDGYGRETCGEAVSYIIQEIPETHSAFEEIALNNEDEDDYTNALEDITGDYVLDYLKDNLYLVAEPNDSDYLKTEVIWEITDNDSDWIPKGEFQINVPERILAHLEAGNIDSWDVVNEIESCLYNCNIDGEVDRPWGHYDDYYTVTGLTTDDMYSIQREYGQYGDSEAAWEYWADELDNEYGDLNEEPEEDGDEEVDESLNEGKYGFLKKYRGCNIDFEPSGYIPQGLNGDGTLGSSKTLSGAESIIDDYLDHPEKFERYPVDPTGKVGGHNIHRKIGEEMTPEERQKFIDSKWIKVKELGNVYPAAEDIRDEFEYNTLTHKFRNISSGRDSNVVDKNIAPHGGGRITLGRNNGKNTDLSIAKVEKAARVMNL